MKRFKIGDKVRNTATVNLGEVKHIHPTIANVPWVSYTNGTGYYVHPDMLELRVVEDEVPQQADQWDEAVRRKKMSAAKGKVIYKYQMPVLEHFTMKLPKGAEIIRMEDQGGMFWLWAIVDTEVEDEERSFYAFKCGGEIPRHLKLKYVGFCAVHVQMELGLYIFEEV